METVQIECRCKDCEHYDSPCENYGCGYCYYWKYEEGMRPNIVDEDDFCSYGVRKEK